MFIGFKQFVSAPFILSILYAASILLFAMSSVASGQVEIPLQQETRRCAEGRVASCLRVAEAAETGNGVAQDPAYARRIYSQLCEDEFIACGRLGDMALSGIGGPQDLLLAHDSYMARCANNLDQIPGIFHACTNAASLAFQGHGAEHLAGNDGALIERLRSLCARQASGSSEEAPIACNVLGNVLRQAPAPFRNLSGAVEAFRASCRQNSDEGCYQFALMARDGIGTQAQPTEANQLLGALCSRLFMPACAEPDILSAPSENASGVFGISSTQNEQPSEMMADDQGIDMAREIPVPQAPEFAAFERCYFIDARKGWQRISLAELETFSPEVSIASQAFFIMGENNASPQALRALGVPYRWSVDDARFSRVGPEGHQGRDAEALEPFAELKYWNMTGRFEVVDSPFGALHARVDANREGYEGFIPEDRVDGHMRLVVSDEPTSIDFRINDTALGDNGGGLVTCVGIINEVRAAQRDAGFGG